MVSDQAEIELYRSSFSLGCGWKTYQQANLNPN